MNNLLLAILFAGVVLAQTAPPLRVSMISLGVKDMGRSIQFYGDILGLKMSGKPGEVMLFQAGEVMIALNAPLGRVSGDRIVGALEVIFPVKSVTSAHAGLAKRGCNFAVAPREAFPGTWSATFTDPDGHRLTILEPR
ncbi:MAG: VOC family protein [Acidobacteriota bacterium]